jgi:Xaa-Pro dipeptidase
MSSAVAPFAMGSHSFAEVKTEEKKALPPAIAALPDRRGEARPVTFAEREIRQENARKLMREKKIDAICLAGGTSLSYFTGIRWGNSERFFGYVLPARGKAFVVCPFFEEGRVREQLAAQGTSASPPIYTWQEDENPYQLVTRGMKELGILSGRLGVEERMPFVFADEVARSSPSLQVVSGTPITAGCRMTKSPAELALMRLASSVTLQVYEAVWRSTAPGITTSEFRELIAAAYTKIGFPGEASCQVGEYSALPHGSLQPQVIRENDIVLIDDGCTVAGYQSDLSRTFVFGKASDKMKRNFEIVHRAQKAALDAVRPGAECQAVDAAARKVIVDAGYGPDYKYFTHRLGHGIGMDGHEWPYLVRGNRLPVEPGMTFSNEPGIYIPGEFGIRLEDDMVVTDSGGELLTPQSHSLEDPFGKG